MKSENTPNMPEIPWMKSLTSCLTKMRHEGYKDDYHVTEQGLCTFDNSRCYQAEDVKIVNFYRFEGESDPGDNTILYVIEAGDGGKGTLVDGYGAYADENVSNFIVEIEKIQKVKVSDLHA